MTTENYDPRMGDNDYVDTTPHEENERLRAIVKTALINAMPKVYDELEIECTKEILINCIKFLDKAIGRDAVNGILDETLGGD